MSDIVVINGRLYSRDTGQFGFVVGADQLGLLTSSDVAGFSIVGVTPAGDAASLAMTADSRLKVDTRPSIDDRNLFSGNPWAAAKSAW